MTVKVEMLVDVPVDATSKQVQEWVEFEVGQRGVLKFENPLADYELEAKNISVRNI